MDDFFNKLDAICCDVGYSFKYHEHPRQRCKFHFLGTKERHLICVSKIMDGDKITMRLYKTNLSIELPLMEWSDASVEDALNYDIPIEAKRFLIFNCDVFKTKNT